MSDSADPAQAAPVIPPRPTRIADDAKLGIARQLAAELLRMGAMEGSTEEEVAQDIAAVARPHMDGFKIARELEQSCGWDCDMEIAEALDAFHGHYAEALTTLERAWAAEHDIQPRLAPGTRVRAKHGWTWRDGVIHGVSEHAVARYLVRDAADPPDVKRWWVVAFEDVTELGAEAPAA